jgi:hypothetical protein
MQLGQKIAGLLGDKDLVNFMHACHQALDAVEGDGGSLWRRRFVSSFETPKQVAGQHMISLSNIKDMYQERKSVLHVIDQVFQTEGNATPRLSFDIGTSTTENVALRVLRDLIIGKWLPIRLHI